MKICFHLIFMHAALCKQLVIAILFGSDPVFVGPINDGKVDDNDVNEVSGIVASRVHPNIVYVHNDKGDSARFFALDTANANVRATFHVDGAHNYDWEDIAYGHCDDTTDSSYCLYLGDIGDHHGDGARDIIYKVREPTVIRDATLPLEASLHFRWPVNGVDAETLMLDDLSHDLYIISKVNGGRGSVARIPYDAWKLNAVYPLTNLSTINIHSSHNDPVGGDISPNSQDILVKTSDNVYYWHLQHGNYQETLSSPPLEVPYKEEHNGESVGWDAQGQGYFTLGEGHHKHLHYYHRS